MATFAYRGQLNSSEEPVIVPMLVANSQTVTVGSAVKTQSFASGSGVMAATAGSKIAGIVAGLVDNVGIDFSNTKQTYTGTYTKSTKTYVASATNTTVDLIKALVIVDPMALFENKSAGNLAVADTYKFFDLTSASQIADQDGADATGAFQLIKLDPSALSDATVGLFRMAENELFNYVQQ